MTKRKKVAIILSLVMGTMLFMLGSCEDKEEINKIEELNKYLEGLPTWKEFSPPLPDQSPTPKGEPDPMADVILNVEEIDDEGKVNILPNIRYSCQVQPYTLTQNPKQIAMYSPDREILYPGALLQGKTHKDGLGSLLGLSIAERSPINVSIPGLANNDNFRTINQPNQATVDQAIGSMVGNAVLAGLSTPSTISFEMSTFHTEKQSALQMGLSGKYLGFSAKTTGDISKKQSETTITAQFYQKMYEVVVEPPQSPGHFFSKDFTAAKLEQQISLGRIGPDNLPVFVSNVVYGRMMMFSITSTASETDIRATLQAGYEGMGKKGNAHLDDKQKKILQSSEIKIASVGGNAQATLDMIKSGDWSQYFTNEAPLTSASPISYTFRNLGDNSIASVTETSEYNIRTCDATPTTPGTFDFLKAQSLGMPINTPVTVRLEDMNANGRKDLIFSHLGVTNQTVIAYSNADGTFSMGQPFTHTESSPTGGWGQYVLKVGDFNNDGLADLAWNRTNITNTTYIGLGKTDKTFELKPVFKKGADNWSSLNRFEVGNIDGINGDDLIWNECRDLNQTYVTFSKGDGTFGEAGNSKVIPGKSNFGSHHWIFSVAKGTSTNRDNLIWHTTNASAHEIYKGEYVPNTSDYLEFIRFDRNSDYPTGWENYRVVIGDIDGIDGADLVWVRTDLDGFKIHRTLRSGKGFKAALNYQIFNYSPAETQKLTQLALLDVNGDGRKDLLINIMDGTINHSAIGHGKTTGDFDFLSLSQNHPFNQVSWGMFKLLVGDINGDKREDVIYINPDLTNTVYVGLAKQQ
jgi:hypothetical protein